MTRPGEALLRLTWRDTQDRLECCHERRQFGQSVSENNYPVRTFLACSCKAEVALPLIGARYYSHVISRADA